MSSLWRVLWLSLIVLWPAQVFGQDIIEEKLYNFDDMLIDGAFRDPQGMFERARTEVVFEGALNLRRSFLRLSEEDVQESSMQP
ncbi:MAG: hypothetical protein FWC40_10160 [Proteobacteria bacterium]|nr:hypothetical protein [Pseudomonadota bacterium]